MKPVYRKNAGGGTLRANLANKNEPEQASYKFGVEKKDACIIP